MLSLLCREQQCYSAPPELNSLTASGKKLVLSLVVRYPMLCSLLPDGMEANIVLCQVGEVFFDAGDPGVAFTTLCRAFAIPVFTTL